jgi:hypothetical protein
MESASPDSAQRNVPAGMSHFVGVLLCSVAMGCIGFGLIYLLGDGMIAMPAPLARIFANDLFHPVHIGMNVFFSPLSWCPGFRISRISLVLAAIVWGALLYGFLLMVRVFSAKREL